MTDDDTPGTTRDQAFIVIEGWCLHCGRSLEGQPLDGPELCPTCERWERTNEQ